jgi:hypothetical protein
MPGCAEKIRIDKCLGARYCKGTELIRDAACLQQIRVLLLSLLPLAPAGPSANLFASIPFTHDLTFEYWVLELAPLSQRFIDN